MMEMHSKYCRIALAWRPMCVIHTRENGMTLRYVWQTTTTYGASASDITPGECRVEKLIHLFPFQIAS